MKNILDWIIYLICLSKTNIKHVCPQDSWRAVTAHIRSFTRSWPRPRCSSVSSRSALLSVTRTLAWPSLTTAWTKWVCCLESTLCSNFPFDAVELTSSKKSTKNSLFLCTLFFFPFNFVAIRSVVLLEKFCFSQRVSFFPIIGALVVSTSPVFSHTASLLL